MEQALAAPDFVRESIAQTRAGIQRNLSTIFFFPKKRNYGKVGNVKEQLLAAVGSWISGAEHRVREENSREVGLAEYGTYGG